MTSETKKYLIIGGVVFLLIAGIIIYRKNNPSKSVLKGADEDLVITEGRDSKGRKYISVPFYNKNVVMKLNNDGTFTIHLPSDKEFKKPSPLFKGIHKNFGESIKFNSGESFTEGTLDKNIKAIEEAMKERTKLAINPQSQLEMIKKIYFE